MFAILLRIRGTVAYAPYAVEGGCLPGYGQMVALRGEAPDHVGEPGNGKRVVGNGVIEKVKKKWTHLNQLPLPRPQQPLRQPLHPHQRILLPGPGIRILLCSRELPPIALLDDRFFMFIPDFAIKVSHFSTQGFLFLW